MYYMEGIILVGLLIYILAGVVGVELWARNQRAQLDLGGIVVAIPDLKRNIQIYAMKRYFYTLLAVCLLAMACFLFIFELITSLWLVGVAWLASILLLILAGYNHSRAKF